MIDPDGQLMQRFDTQGIWNSRGVVMGDYSIQDSEELGLSLSCQRHLDKTSVPHCFFDLVIEMDVLVVCVSQACFDVLGPPSILGKLVDVNWVDFGSGLI